MKTDNQKQNTPTRQELKKSLVAYAQTVDLDRAPKTRVATKRKMKLRGKKKLNVESGNLHVVSAKNLRPHPTNVRGHTARVLILDDVTDEMLMAAIRTVPQARQR